MGLTLSTPSLVVNIYVAFFLRRETALICAARTGQLDCVRHLLNYGADTERRDGEGHTALWCAVREQREEVVTYLIHRYSGPIRGLRVCHGQSEGSDITND